MYDVLIIGSGPAGLSAAIYAKRANLDVRILEKNMFGTGQVAESSEVDNYLGLPHSNGFDLGDKFRKHAEGLGVEFITGEAARIVKEDGIFKITLKNGEILESKTVIYGAGATHRHLDVPGENELRGHGVSYCATCDGGFYRGKTVAVFGGGDTAINDALYLSKLASKVYIVHRREEFRGSKQYVDKLLNTENIEPVLSEELKNIEGDTKVQSVLLKSGRKIEVDGVFIAVGMNPLTDILQGTVDIDASGYIIAGEDCVTSLPGFFAAGDVRTKKLRQVITAAADGANAVDSAIDFLKNSR